MDASCGHGSALCAFPSSRYPLKLRSRRKMVNQPPALPTFSGPQVPHIPVRLVAVLAAIVVLIILVWTSYYTVQAESEGVVLRFGRFLTTVEPGLHFKL